MRWSNAIDAIAPAVYVAADAGQRADGLDFARKLAAVLGDNLLRRGVQLPRTAVIAEPFPLAEDGLFLGRRQSRNRRKSGQECRIPRPHGGDRRLLEHDLADQISYGSRDPRQGRSRACSAYHAAKRCRNCVNQVAGGSDSAAFTSSLGAVFFVVSFVRERAMQKRGRCVNL